MTPINSKAKTTEQVMNDALEAKKRVDELLLSQIKPVEIPADSVWVVDAKSGCHFMGRDLIHTDKCLCDWDDQ